MGTADPGTVSALLLGSPLLGSVANLEERGRSGYMAVVRGLLDALAIQPGESVLEVGCGSGVIPLAPIEDAGVGAVPSSHLCRVRLDLMLATTR